MRAPNERPDGVLTFSFVFRGLQQCCKAPKLTPMGGERFSKKGSLRDFRVDTVTGQFASETPREKSSTNDFPKQNIAAASQQYASPQRVQSSVEEWDREAFADEGVADMWKTWENDLDQLEKKTLSSAAMRQEIKEVEKASESIEKNQIVEEEASVRHRATMPWAADLAITERRMERRGEVEYSSSFQKQELLKIQTAEYMEVLRAEFGRNIDLFNDARQSGSHAIHLYRVSNTDHDFMLFRNGIKLLISGQRSGRILLTFNQFLGQVYNPSQTPQFELEAQWGPFDRLFWSYKGERVQVQDVVRYFISEFVKQSYK